MIRKILTAFATSVCCYFVSSFLVLQFLYLTTSDFNSVNDLHIATNYKVLSQGNNNQIMFVIKVICLIVFAWMLLKDLGINKAKSLYEKTSYSKLLHNYQRKRGTVRVQYNDNGLITRDTLECYYDNLMLPLTRLQNKFCSLYHLPERKKWNTVKNFFNSDGELRHNSSGIPCVAYRKYFIFGKYNRVNYINDVVHALFVGMSGKGKSMTYVLPMLNANIDAGECMFVHDPKKELLCTMRKKLEREGYKVIVIDFVNPEESDGWNPLAYAYDRWKKALVKADTEDYHLADLSTAIELVLDISKTISYEEDSSNPFWHEGAGDMIAAAAFLLMEEGNEDLINFTSINYIYQLGKDNNILDKFCAKYRTPEDQSVLKMDTFQSAEGVTKSGLMATFKNKMSLLTSTPAIQSLLAKNTWTYDEIFDKKTAIFMVTHDEKSTFYPLVTIFIKQLYESMIKWSRDNENLYKGKLKTPWNMYIDEMGLLPEIKDIEAMYGAGRSRGVRIYAFFQSFAQIIQKYETNGAKIIQDNSTHTIYLGSKLKEVAEEFQKIAGNELFYNRSKKTWEERPLLTSEKLQLFERGRSLITAVEWDPFVSKLPPYNEYVFAEEENHEKHLVYKDKVKWFNISKAYQDRQSKKFKSKGVKTVKFNSIASNNKAKE